MIDVRELRIGTFVSQYHSWGVAVPYWRNWEIAIGDDINHVMGNPNKYNGIPLTEEWLVRFGFVKDNNGNYWIDLQTHYLEIMLSAYCYPVCAEYGELSNEPEHRVSLNRIQYVHQLQNLYFALTGEELTIKL